MSDPVTSQIEVYPDRESGWYWRLRAGNGETVATSECFPTKPEAIRAATAAFPDVQAMVTTPE